MPAPDDARARLYGILLVNISSSLFGVVDGLSKLLADKQSVGQIVAARYVLALPVLIATIRPADWRRLFRTAVPKLQIVRGLVPVVISVSMVLAVRHLPLAEATVVLFTGPFLVVALSAPLLGERVRPASWIGVGVGFAAVLIVARPGFNGLSGYVLLPLIAAVFYALFQLATRGLGRAGEAPHTTLAWTLATGALLAVPLAAFTWAPVDLRAVLLLVALGLVFGLAQTTMIRAFRLAPASLLTPFSYAQLVAAAIFGMVVFSAVPDVATWFGIALIIGAGAYVVRSQRA
jgi:drug/metabolite transporter (DMT)-like permease